MTGAKIFRGLKTFASHPYFYETSLHTIKASYMKNQCPINEFITRSKLFFERNSTSFDGHFNLFWIKYWILSIKIIMRYSKRNIFAEMSNNQRTTCWRRLSSLIQQ